MSDDRLFATNNPIGRKFFIINIIMLILITIGTNYLFNQYIMPEVKSEFYDKVANVMRYLINGAYVITLFALVDRRLFDICGTRSHLGYKIGSNIIIISAFWWLFEVVYLHTSFNLPIPPEAIYFIGYLFVIISLFVIFIISFPKGKISGLSYEEYRKKIKFEE